MVSNPFDVVKSRVQNMPKALPGQVPAALLAALLLASLLAALLLAALLAALLGRRQVARPEHASGPPGQPLASISLVDSKP